MGPVRADCFSPAPMSGGGYRTGGRRRMRGCGPSTGGRFKRKRSMGRYRSHHRGKYSLKGRGRRMSLGKVRYKGRGYPTGGKIRVRAHWRRVASRR